MTSTQIIAIVIFLVTMAAIMTEKLHRTVAAVAGALLLILTGVLSVESGFSYVDLNTLGVLIGMMLFVAVVKNSGIFEYIAIKAAKIAKGRPWPLMVLFALITAVLSALPGQCDHSAPHRPHDPGHYQHAADQPHSLLHDPDHGLQHRRHRHPDR